MPGPGWQEPGVCGVEIGPGGGGGGELAGVGVKPPRGLGGGGGKRWGGRSPERGVWPPVRQGLCAAGARLCQPG